MTLCPHSLPKDSKTNWQGSYNVWSLGIFLLMVFLRDAFQIKNHLILELVQTPFSPPPFPPKNLECNILQFQIFYERPPHDVSGIWDYITFPKIYLQRPPTSYISVILCSFYCCTWLPSTTASCLLEQPLFWYRLFIMAMCKTHSLEIFLLLWNLELHF